MFRYPNDQRATTLWYHDPTPGMTRLNINAEPAGFYLLRWGQVANPYPEHFLDQPQVSETTPSAHITKSLLSFRTGPSNVNGSLSYPDRRTFFDEYAGPFIPETPVSTIWNPEFFGNIIV